MSIKMSLGERDFVIAQFESYQPCVLNKRADTSTEKKIVFRKLHVNEGK